MNILVTGGAGYVGSTLSAVLLGNGHSVRVIDSLMHGGTSLLPIWSHPQFKFILGDLRDPQTMASAVQGVDAVVHLAAIVGDPACSRQPELARSTNRDASIALINACQRAGVSRFLFASTCSNYGKMKDPSRLVDETSELSPVSLYAETKVAVEKVLLNPANTGDLCATPLRFATVFGVSPRMRFDLTVNEFAMEILTKRKLVVFGEQFWRPYIHVRDAARGIMAVLEADAAKVRNQVFNVGATSQNYTKQMLVDLLRPYAPDAVVEFVHKSEDPRDYRVSFAKIESALGFNITRTIEDGIREVVRLVEAGIIKDYSAPQFRN
jgi:nucleoside-diphosphate-sugar epimerase